MTTKFARTIAAACLVALAGSAALPAPAMAGGQLSLSFAPNDPDQAQALGMGMQVFSLVQGMSGKGAYVRQNGKNNTAGGAQSGWNNNGIIVQQGNGHTGTITQKGNNNSCGLFQFGKNTNAQCNQTGNGQSNLTTVFGF